MPDFAVQKARLDNRFGYRASRKLGVEVRLFLHFWFLTITH